MGRNRSRSLLKLMQNMNIIILLMADAVCLFAALESQLLKHFLAAIGPPSNTLTPSKKKTWSPSCTRLPCRSCLTAEALFSNGLKRWRVNAMVTPFLQQGHDGMSINFWTSCMFWPCAEDAFWPCAEDAFGKRLHLYIYIYVLYIYICIYLHPNHQPPHPTPTKGGGSTFAAGGGTAWNVYTLTVMQGMNPKIVTFRVPFASGYLLIWVLLKTLGLG